jgi:hypothetical protein
LFTCSNSEKGFVLNPWPNVLKHFTSVIYECV